MSVQFKDNSMQVKSTLNETVAQYLHEAAGEMVSQTQRNTRVDSGQLKGSWDYKVRMGGAGGEATIGSSLENAIWEEFGTGEYAIEGNGRKGGWTYKDAKGKWHFTKGKKPSRAFKKAYTALKSKLIKRAEQILSSKMK